MENVGAVYAITNRLTDRVYFGETTRGGDLRLHEHRSGLENKRERNKSLQRDYSEVGAENFTFETIIETNEHVLCELVLIEIFSRIGMGYRQRRGNQIQKVLSGEGKIPEEVYQKIEAYINQRHDKSDYHSMLLCELKDIKENGFQCKSEDIYNRKFKNLFWNGYSSSTRRVDECRFKKVAIFEKQEKKDLYDFTLEEAEKVLYSLGAKRVRSIQNHISRLRIYLNFAMNQGVSKNETNYYDYLSKSEIASKYLKTTDRSNSKTFCNHFNEKTTNNNESKDSIKQ
ncbi:phage lytic cycle repressor MrpR family protein [Priestia flexa]|uniref:phage lytic cycle repressor MrpR family protein n=1 Tax=Priestia flexa TaxID=86664 RepID=UPI001CD40E15|nr:hypothetical protein [Priestia flexa]MCA1200856.1 hypothetical protein [Priestia flexa]